MATETPPPPQPTIEINLKATSAPTSPAGNIIELKNVHKFYTLGAKRLHVLKGISLEIPRGQYVAIMGSSGSGKSTLLNLLGLLDVVDAGDYMLAGSNVARMKDDLLAKHRNAQIGFIFQSFNLFPQLDVLGNIEVPMVYQNIPLQKRRARAKELAEAVGLGHRLGHRPRQLSGGEMQAHRHRPRAGQRPAAAAGRRADGQPRRINGQRDPRPLRPARRQGPDDGPRHAQPGVQGARAPRAPDGERGAGGIVFVARVCNPCRWSGCTGCKPVPRGSHR
jgi:predicted ABC-type transport system involved in lysophospholipase L1 biosynthesis ATPase subunit